MNSRLGTRDSNLAFHTYYTPNRKTLRKIWLQHKQSFFSSMRMKQ